MAIEFWRWELRGGWRRVAAITAERGLFIGEVLILASIKMVWSLIVLIVVGLVAGGGRTRPTCLDLMAMPKP
jgi:hypothetical protein